MKFTLIIILLMCISSVCNAYEPPCIGVACADAARAKINPSLAPGPKPLYNAPSHIPSHTLSNTPGNTPGFAESYNKMNPPVNKPSVVGPGMVHFNQMDQLYPNNFPQYNAGRGPL